LGSAIEGHKVTWLPTEGEGPTGRRNRDLFGGRPEGARSAQCALT